MGLPPTFGLSLAALLQLLPVTLCVLLCYSLLVTVLLSAASSVALCWLLPLLLGAVRADVTRAGGDDDSL